MLIWRSCKPIDLYTRNCAPFSDFYGRLGYFCNLGYKRTIIDRLMFFSDLYLTHEELPRYLFTVASISA